RASTGLEFPVKTSSWSLTLSDIFNFPASSSSCDSSVTANYRADWLGGKDSNLRMPGPKPGALPAWRPPSAFGFKGSGPALLPTRQLKLTAGEATCGRSAGESQAIQSNRTEPPRDRTAQLSRRTCPDFDFSSRCAGIAMLLMRFFAVNASRGRPCTAKARLLHLRLFGC